MSSFDAKEALLSGFETNPEPQWNDVGTSLYLNRKRYHHGAVALPDGDGAQQQRILAVGGYEDGTSDATLRSVEVYDDRNSARKWNKKWPKLNQSRAQHATAAVGLGNDKKVHVLGGRDNKGECLDSIECLDLALKSPKWTTLKTTTLSSKRSACAAVTVGSRIYIIGGCTSGSSCLDRVDVLDTPTNERCQGPSLRTARLGCAAVLVDGTIFVVGGQDASGSAVSTIESLDVSGDDTAAVWQPCAMALSAPRSFPAIAAVAHCLLVIGGRSKDEKALASVEVIDTKRNVAWTLSDLLQPCYGCTAVTVSESRVLVIGGRDSDGGSAPCKSMQVLKLELCPFSTQIDAVEKELQQLKRGGGSSIKKLFGNNKNKSSGSAAKLLKAYLRELKERSSVKPLESEDVTYDSPRDDIAYSFSDEFPHYDNGRIVAKKELKDSGQARVYKGVMKERDGSKKDVAVKVFKTKQDWDDCKQELISLLKISGHPNVMEVLDFYEVPMPSFVMRYVSGGDLRDHLDKKGKFTGKHATRLLRGIGDGLEHLHNHAIVHRDLKSPNILLEGKGNTLNPVVIDLGLGKTMETTNMEEGKQFQTRGIKGTAAWMAPEMMISGKWSTKTDMFALGVIMWEILTAASPYPGKYFTQVVNVVAYENARPDKGQMKKARVSQAHQDMVESLWHTDPSQRPSVEEFLTQLE